MSKVYWSALTERAIMERPFRCFMDMAHRAGELGYEYINNIPRMRPDLARDAICEEFKKRTQNPNDFLVTCDIDHNNPRDLIERLVFNDKPVVAALAVRSNPARPEYCFWIRDENGILKTPRTFKKELIRATIVGTGAIAIKRGVFAALDEAGYDKGYFKYQYHPDGSSSSEEILFSQMLEEIGIPCFVDTRIIIPHWADAELDDTSAEEYYANHPVIVKEHKVSVIIPQWGRIEKFRKALDTLLATAPQVEVIVVIDEDDLESKAIAYENKDGRVCFLESAEKNPLVKWNYGASKATGDVIVAAANDVEFQDKWLEYALDALGSVPDENAMVAFNDTVTMIEVSSPHFLMTREYITKYNGGVLMPPVYAFQFADVENRLRAQSIGRYVCAKASIVKHLHPMTNTAPHDEIHAQGAYKYFEQDQKLFLARKADNFPIAWQPVVQ